MQGSIQGKAKVFAVDYEGRGVARADGKTVFIQGALPGEEVAFHVTRSKKSFDEADVTHIYHASPDRIEPACQHFGVCGGCVLQHASVEAQVAFKQRVMEEQLLRIGKVQPEDILPPIYGSAWAYRHRARLSVSKNKQGRLLLGFRSRRSNEVVNLNECPVLPPHVEEVLPHLRTLLGSFSDNVVVEYVEFSVGKLLTALNIRTNTCLSEKDLDKLKIFSDRHLQTKRSVWQIWLQTKQSQANPFYPENMPDLFYEIPEFGVRMPFRPGDFTQINQELNTLMIERAVRMLEPKPEERVIDLFCGLGNFTLPIAKSGAHVLGIEGAEHLVQRARKNAKINGCAENTHFETADLFSITEADIRKWGEIDKILLDPPRSGAYEIVKALCKPFMPKRIVYVSCNPATFARDAHVIIEKGYKFKEVGIMNMFPQTAHVESIGLFFR